MVPSFVELTSFSVSNKASADQELTPIFENFRKQLDRKEAGGDIPIYEALDSASIINSPPDSKTH
jgi:hypothetical protein